VSATRTKPLAAGRLVIGVPLFVLGLWVAQMLFARAAAHLPRSAALAAMGRWHSFDDGHRLRALVELIARDRAVLVTVHTTLTATVVAAALFSVLAAPAILVRLQGKSGATTMAEASARYLGPMFVQSIYGGLFRAVCAGVGVIPLALFGPTGLPLFALLASFPVLVLDRARAAVVLEGARPYHPGTFARAISHVAVRPLLWLSGTILDTAKVGVGVAALCWVASGAGGASAIWIARLGGLAALVFGLWRIALAVQSATPDSAATDSRSDDPATAN